MIALPDGEYRIDAAIVGGQLPENPSIHNILVEGDVVYDPARDGIKIDGTWQHPAPHYPMPSRSTPSRRPCQSTSKRLGT